MLLQGAEKAESDAYFRALSAQTVFLSKRWQKAAPGLPRFEALTGLISAGLALDGMQGQVGPAVAALARIAKARSTSRAASRRATPKNCWRCSPC